MRRNPSTGFMQPRPATKTGRGQDNGNGAPAGYAQKAGDYSPAAAPTNASHPFQPHYPAGPSPFAALRPAPVLASSLSGTAAATLTAFAAKSGNGKWPHLPRAVIAQRLTNIVANPVLPDQASLNACGPAATMHLHAKRKPNEFAQFVTELYDNGSARFGSISVSGSGLFGKDPSKMTWHGSQTPLADWMYMSTLRRSKDTLIQFEGEPDNDLSAITLPGDMEDWFENGIGYSSVSNQANKMIRKGVDHLKGLQTAPDKDIVLLINVTNIDANLTKKGGKDAAKGKSLSRSLGGFGGKVASIFPNHYVVLEKPVELIGGDIKATVWTWGTAGYVLQTSEKVWADNYFGALICKV